MDTDQTTICTSQNVHIGQEVVIVDRIQLGHCISYADGTCLLYTSPSPRD